MVGYINNESCPLCQYDSNFWFEHEIRFFCCSNCKLVFKHPSAWLSPTMEKARYDKHNNDPQDTRYIAFLNKLLLPLTPLLAPNSHGLDFGCGPSKATEKILSEMGFFTHSYDPFYFPDTTLLTRQYDFICCSEVFEHFFYPLREVTLLNKCLLPGGLLAVMTSPYPPKEDFPNWYYWKDPTHVCFYSIATFNYIAQMFSWELIQRTDTTFYFKVPSTIV